MKPYYEYSLYPCPFCLGDKLDVKRRKYDGDTLFRIKCDKCGILSGEYDTIQGAIVAWNNRPVEMVEE